MAQDPKACCWDSGGSVGVTDLSVVTPIISKGKGVDLVHY